MFIGLFLYLSLFRVFYIYKVSLQNIHPISEETRKQEKALAKGKVREKNHNGLVKVKYIKTS